MKRSKNNEQSKSDKLKTLFVKDGDGFRCTVEKDCTYHPKDLLPANLNRHVHDQHPDAYNILGIGEIPDEEVENLLKKKRSRQTPAKNNEVAIARVSKQKVVGGVIKLVTLHGAPLNAVNWEGLRDIIDPLLTALKITLNSKNITTFVRNTSEAIDNIIKAELKDEMLSFKLDTTSKMHRSVLGVNVQFFKGVNLTKRSLGKA